MGAPPMGTGAGMARLLPPLPLPPRGVRRALGGVALPRMAIA